MACVLAGPPTTNSGARSNKQKEFENSLRDRNHRWPILCVQEFTPPNVELVTETTERHQVFATPPCPEQGRLAIVVAAAFDKCIVDSSFWVRNCLVDVCWERKKISVICSQLNPGKFGAHVCEGLGGPQHGDDTCEGCACPYFCGRSNRTRYWGTRSHQQ